MLFFTPSNPPISQSRPSPYDLFKRILDVMIASALLLILSPIIILIMVVVKLNCRGSVIYRQSRLTKNAKVFTMYKFRTMCPDAESASGAIFASKNDPRVTTVGKVLRRFRLDELPQLLNVLFGEMSLVGPRPERPEMLVELMRKHPNFEERHRVLAGLTGLAQVTNGYSSSNRQYRHKLRCDKIYIQNRGLLLDLRILAKTVVVAISGKGAC